MMKKQLILLLLFLGSTLFTQMASSVPGDSFTDPITAQLGDNYGTISGTESEYFWFAGTGQYLFSLVGPSGTDLDMAIYDANINYIGSASSTTYPDTDRVKSTTGYYIEVYSYSGTGSFTLTITSDSSGSQTNPLQAYVGYQYEDLFYTGDEVYYILNEGAGTYEFNLYGDAAYNDFDIEVFDSTWNQIDGSYGTTYPETVTAAVDGTAYIRVYSYSGLGWFELGISQLSSNTGYSSAEYYDMFNVGLQLTWSLVVSDGSQSYYSSYGIEILSNHLVDYAGTDDALFRVTDEDYSYVTDNPDIPLLPLRMYFDDGTIFNFVDILYYYFDGAFIDCVAGECSISFSESGSNWNSNYQLYYNMATGLLLSYSASSTQDGVTTSFTATLDNDINSLIMTITSLVYYDGFRAGDVLEWSISETDSTGTTTDTFSIEILQDSPVDTDPYNDNGLFRVTNEDGSIENTDDVMFPLLPVSVTFSDGTSWGISDIISIVFSEFTSSDVTVNCDTNECTLSYSETFEGQTNNLFVRYDMETGVLLEYQESVTYGGQTSSFVATLTTNLDEIKNNNNNTTDGGFSLPFNYLGALLFLLAVPVIRLRKDKK